MTFNVFYYVGLIPETFVALMTRVNIFRVRLQFEGPVVELLQRIRQQRRPLLRLIRVMRPLRFRREESAATRAFEAFQVVFRMQLDPVTQEFVKFGERQLTMLTHEIVLRLLEWRMLSKRFLVRRTSCVAI